MIDKYKVSVLRKKKLADVKLHKSVTYSSENYGIGKGLTGKFVKIAILDTGCPAHMDLKNIVDSVSFIDEDESDAIGHATAMAGIIAADNSEAIRGLAYDSELYFAKVFDKHGQGNFNSIVSGILWGIVKKVDIILLAISADVDYPVLNDCIKKAYDQGICIIAASKVNKVESKEGYPAYYKEALACKYNTNKSIKKIEYDGNSIIMVLPQDIIYTTAPNNKYTSITGTSVAAAFTAGLAACVIERMRKDEIDNGEELLPYMIYNRLGQLKWNKC